ncbi:ras-related protein Rab-28 [Octopus bimaculoides]|uniref:Ras-related protein Rab-28 n=1 Tax=Octopus bimaculoides TaxID=37653 RepID=A0A0L8HGU3_OCTBM|nr:ras-related protein Rab-28 [Octopus bimaculoides]|eukprot:XP_014772441.1 PREDICTED: ras-related protein Rab-28-like [Octopus bimaculoides]
MSDSDNECFDERLKIVIVGDRLTGKTSIATRYTQDNFWKEYKKTMGVDFYLKRIILRGQMNVVLQIWDISGICLGSSMLENYIYGAQGIILVYDITNYISFENLEDWLLTINRSSLHSGKSPSHLALVGNKVDLEHVRAVSEERHVKFAADHNMSNHFISAKTGEYVSVCFQRIAAELVGLKLTAAEKEQHQQVVTANIECESSPKVTSVQNSPRSPICSLQ